MSSRKPGAITQDRTFQTLNFLYKPLVNVSQLRAKILVNVSQLMAESQEPFVHLSQLSAKILVNVSQLSAESQEPFDRLCYSPLFRPSMSSRNPGAITQDWEPVVLHKSKPKAQDLRNPKAVNQALQSGAPVRTVKKFDAGSNKKLSPVVNVKKLDEGTEPEALDKVPAKVRHAIQKARLEKKMSQSELAKLINERLQVVQEYENGKAVPNQAVLGKMEKVLGVKLRGKISK